MGTPTRQDLASLLELRQAPKLERLVRLGPQLARVKIARKIGPHLGRPFQATARTFWGDRMRVVLPESLSCEIAAYRYFEEGLTTFMLDCVKPGMVVYDVGAHYGYFTLLAARLAGPTGQVHSFEPTPSTFAILQLNTAQMPNVTVNNAAVWHEQAELKMRDFGPAWSMYNSLFNPRLPRAAGAPREVERLVSGVALDGYATGRAADLVKIDAESAEMHVLSGMRGLLEDHKPLVTLEVGDFNIDGAPPSRSLLEHVIAYGYEPFEYANGIVQRHELRDRYGYDNILLVPA